MFFVGFGVAVWLYFGWLSCKHILDHPTNPVGDGLLLGAMLPMGLLGWLIMKAVQADINRIS